MSASMLIAQCGQRLATPRVRPTLSQNPALPKDFRQLGQGISTKVQKPAASTTPISTAKMILMARILGAPAISAPMIKRKAIAQVRYRSVRRLRYWRIVIAVASVMAAPSTMAAWT
jgi:hypothetical protein